MTVGLWAEWALACYSLVSRSRSVEAVSSAKASARPGASVNYTHSLRARQRTCSGSACAGSLSGLKPLLYAMVKCVLATKGGEERGERRGGQKGDTSPTRRLSTRRKQRLSFSFCGRKREAAYSRVQVRK